MDPSDVAELNIETYNVPDGGDNLLGNIGYSTQQFFSEAGKPNVSQPLFWIQVTQHWLHIASKLEVMVNHSYIYIYIYTFMYLHVYKYVTPFFSFFDKIPFFSYVCVSIFD